VRLAGIDVYRDSFDEVPGWMHTQDLKLFDLFLAHQLDAGIHGDILEIGCFHGKSAIALGYGLREDEHLEVCDLFGPTRDMSAEGMGHYVGLSIDDFERNYLMFHDCDRNPVVAHSIPSQKLPDRIRGQKFRFIHVDGAHDYDTVYIDTQTAKRCVSKKGIIAFDDYRTEHTPGVSAAVWKAACQGLIYPFCLSGIKLYAAATLTDHAFWLKACRGFGLSWEEHLIFDRPLLRVGVNYA